MFELHGKLREDTAEVTDLGLCRVLLMDDVTVPWLILVPMRVGAREVHDLTKEERASLIEEIAAASRVVEDAYGQERKIDKLNIGALGNIVPQLHIHVIGRREGDRAWPGPVWGAPGRVRYTREGLALERERIRKAFLGPSPL